MPSAVTSSVTVVRSLGMQASFHDRQAVLRPTDVADARLAAACYWVNRGVSWSSSGPTVAAAAACSSVLS